MIACAGLFAGITVYENSEVHWTRKDTAFIWLKGCQLIETCDGYQEALKEAMKDSTLTNSEFWVLKEIYNDGYDKHRMKGLD
tara:strand:- start:273 stop:518 length:246 start_codon:yes stop_codon:yes gene_type:complete